MVAISSGRFEQLAAKISMATSVGARSWRPARRKGEDHQHPNAGPDRRPPGPAPGGHIELGISPTEGGTPGRPSCYRPRPRESGARRHVHDKFLHRQSPWKELERRSQCRCGGQLGHQFRDDPNRAADVPPGHEGWQASPSRAHAVGHDTGLPRPGISLPDACLRPEQQHVRRSHHQGGIAWLEEYLERQHEEANDQAEDHRSDQRPANQPRPAACYEAPEPE